MGQIKSGRYVACSGKFATGWNVRIPWIAMVLLSPAVAKAFPTEEAPWGVYLF